MDKSCKMERNFHGLRWTTWFLWKEGVKPSDVHCQSCAICGEKASAGSTVFSWVQIFNSGKETAGVVVQDWCRNTPQQLFREAILKLSRR
jgi:hypothetical protein